MNNLISNIPWTPMAAGLAGQYVAPMLPMVVPMEEKTLQHLGVAAGVGLLTMDPVLAGAAGVTDYGLCKLYEAVPTLEVLTPVRGAISAATAVYIRTLV